MAKLKLVRDNFKNPSEMLAHYNANKIQITSDSDALDKAVFDMFTAVESEIRMMKKVAILTDIKYYSKLSSSRKVGLFHQLLNFMTAVFKHSGNTEVAQNEGMFNGYINTKLLVDALSYYLDKERSNLVDFEVKALENKLDKFVGALASIETNLNGVLASGEKPSWADKLELDADNVIISYKRGE